MRTRRNGDIKPCSCAYFTNSNPAKATATPPIQTNQRDAKLLSISRWGAASTRTGSAAATVFSTSIASSATGTGSKVSSMIGVATNSCFAAGAIPPRASSATCRDRALTLRSNRCDLKNPIMPRINPTSPAKMTARPSVTNPISSDPILRLPNPV